jgi:HSP20 family molecular chaperone IbpA
LQDVDVKGIAASTKDGILTVTLPKLTQVRFEGLGFFINPNDPGGQE